MFRWMLVCSCLMAAALAFAPAQSAKSGKSVLVVRVPANADVMVGSQKMTQTGPERRFETGVLEAGTYSYELSATWKKKDGTVVTKTRTATFQAGETVTVDFGASTGTKTEPKKADPEPKKEEPKKVETKKTEPEPKKEEPKKVDPEPKKVETKKVDTEPKKAEPKKVEPKKEAPIVPPLKGTSKTIDLFDGKSLAGWEGYEDHWSVKDGVIVGKNTTPVGTSTYLLTKDKFTDFRLIFEFKLAPGSETHSGVAFWGKVPPTTFKDAKEIEAKRAKYTYQGHLVMFPSGWGMFDLFRRNSLPVPGAAGKKAGKQHDWNEIEVLAQGNRVRVAANGVAIVDWRDPQPEMVGEGPIGLQLHSEKGPQETLWKGLKIETFPKEDRLITVKDAK